MTSPELLSRDCKRNIRDLLVHAEHGSASDRVDAGFLLQEVASLAKKAVDQVKSLLRVDATSQMSGGATSVHLVGKMASAKVAAPESILRMSEGADIDALRRVLGDDFEEFFTVQTIITPNKDAMKRLLELPEDKQKQIFTHLAQNVGAGGVGFSPRRTT